MLISPGHQAHEDERRHFKNILLINACQASGIIAWLEVKVEVAKWRLRSTGHDPMEDDETDI